jgi:alkylation response protein AidB-like acyl-CoA dehydrogenase
MRRTIFEAEHEAYRQVVREFVNRHLATQIDRHRQEHSIDRQTWRRAGEFGLLGFFVPEQYGGGGAGDFRFNAVQGEELSRLSYGYASAFGINTDIVAPYLLELTTEQQKQRWLPPFGLGELIASIAITEPGAGSDVLGIRTTARRDGSGWILNGAKTFITNGSSADLIIVAAKSEQGKPSRSISLFVVETAVSPIGRGPSLEKVGQTEVETSELFFDDVYVQDANLLGEPGSGFGYMVERLAQERLSCAVASLGHARAALDETIEHVRHRSAFGQSIGAFQATRFRLAECHTMLDVATAWIDRCIEAHVQGELTPVDAAKAKLAATEVQNKVIDHCLQLHGGYGYMQEYRIARAWQDARVTRIFGGTSEVMREIIGRSLSLSAQPSRKGVRDAS